MASGVFFVGLDDTDFGERIGTGALARELMLYLEREQGVRPRGITRHQLLVHPDVPYTSHNSAACLELESIRSVDDLARACRHFVELLPHPGADPGLCVCPADSLPQRLLELGRNAQQVVVSKQEYLDGARQHDWILWELGGEGIGVIGALSACALRMSGDDGRFISLAGIREVARQTTAGCILEGTPVERVVDQDGRSLDATDRIDTQNWVRPDLKNGKIVLQVQRLSGGDGYRIERKKKDEG